MDINTIFYFPSQLTFEDYSQKVRDGEISSRTIVFADNEKAIYKGGKKYGLPSDQEFKDLIDSLYGDSWISDEINNIKDDITESTSQLEDLNDTVSGIEERLDQNIQDLNDNIESKVSQLMQDSTWLQENFPQGVTYWDSGWNSELDAYMQSIGYWTVDDNDNVITQWSKLQRSVNSVESSLSNLKEEGNLTQALTSSINQLIQDDISSLNLGTTYASASDVAGVKEVIEWMYSGLDIQSGNSTTFAQMLSAANDNISSAISDIRTQVDKIKNGDFVAQTEVSSKVRNTIATMLTESSSENGLASLSARMTDVETAESTNAENIASVILGVTGTNATSNISTAVANALSGFASSSDVSSDIASAKSEIYSSISALDGNDDFISLSALKTQSDADHSSISGIATRVGTLETNQAGFVATSNLDTAVAQMFASSGDGQSSTAKANVVALVKDNKSSLELTADDVNITGYLTGGDASFKGNIEATSFTTGAANEIGIGVMSGEFDELLANTNKAYFAYDSSQSGITMWYYQNNQWKRLNLSDSAVLNDPDSFEPKTFYILPDTSVSIVPSGLTQITLYYNRVTAKYYNTMNTADPATGSYCNIPNYSEMTNCTVTPLQYWNSCDVCSVKEHRADGTVVNSGMLSGIPGDSHKSYSVQMLVVNNGVITSNQGVMVNMAISDIYLTSNGTISKAILAPVITVWSNQGWSTTGSSYTMTTSNGKSRSANAIAPDGKVKSGTSNIPTTMVRYRRVSIADALTIGSNLPSGYDNYNASIYTWPVSYTVQQLICPGDAGYPY